MLILKKIGVIFLKIGISLALLFFLFRQIDFSSLLTIIRKSYKPAIYLAFLLTGLVYFFCFFRWKILLDAAGINLPKKRLVSAFSGGVFFNMFLPSSIGGDFVRSADIGYHSKKNSAAVATVFMDRLSGFAGMTILALFAMIIGFQSIKNVKIFYAVCFLVIILFAVILCVFNNPIYRFFRKILSSPRQVKIRQGLLGVLEQVRGFKKKKSVLFKIMLLSLAVQVIGPVATYLLSLAFHLQISIVYFFLFIPIIGAVTLLPISLGGLGVRDYTTIVLFSSLGISKDLAFAFSLLTFFFLIAYAAIGGLIYALTLHHRRV